MTQTAPGYVLPKWFLAIATVAVGLGVPWIVWASSVLWTLQVRIESVGENKDRLSEVEMSIMEHRSDPTIHHAGLMILNGRLDDIDRRLTAIEAKLP